MPKAVRFDEYGGIDVLHVAEVARPVPGAGQLLVEVKAAAINPGEMAIREGAFAQRWPATFRLADRVHGGQERLGREVLGQAGVAAAGQQVAVDVRQRIVVQLQQPERRVGPHLRMPHTLIVVWEADTPTG
jgi:NADPH:quinone reductase-like Zn-dependent oxidoreductase